MYDAIVETIKSTIIEYETLNQLRKLWEEPIIGIISAEDEQLKILKETVSGGHFMPFDILPGAKSIICFFIPFREDIVKSNIRGTMASEE